MAHFAKILNNTVINVIVAEPEFFDSFIDTSPGEYIQTSYNTRGGVHYDPMTGLPSADQSKSLRKNFAGIGFTYNRELDAFIPPQTHASWTLNEETCLWVCPVAYPTEEGVYNWDEETKSWVSI